jgi:transposase
LIHWRREEASASKAQMRRIKPYFPPSHGARVDDRRMVSGIVFVIRNGLRWRDAPRGYGAHKKIYNRFVRWSRCLGVFNKSFAELARKGGKPRPAPDLMAGCDSTPDRQWIARQLTEACDWEWTSSYIARDRDRVYGEINPGSNPGPPAMHLRVRSGHIGYGLFRRHR